MGQKDRKWEEEALTNELLWKLLAYEVEKDSDKDWDYYASKIWDHHVGEPRVDSDYQAWSESGDELWEAMMEFGTMED